MRISGPKMSKETDTARTIVSETSSRHGTVALTAEAEEGS